MGQVFNANDERQVDANGPARQSNRSIRRILTPVAQQADWDCGIACVEMVLWFLRGEPFCRTTLLALVGTQSVWTIDLVLLLHSAGVRSVVFWTTCVGIEPMYADWPFYRNAFVSDRARVETRFAEAARNGIRIRSELLPTEALIPAKYSEYLTEHGLLTTDSFAQVIGDIDGRDVVWIVLVDQRRLRYGPRQTHISWWDKPLGYLILLQSVIGWLPRSGFRGHYVVVVDYCPAVDAFVVFDPACPTGALNLQRHVLNDARLAPGTDGDTIMVPLPASDLAAVPDTYHLPDIEQEV